MKKTIVIIDAGGRGSALMDAYSKSSHVKRLIAIPGNDLMPLLTQKPVEIHTDLKTTSIPEIIEICRKNNVDLIDVAQDNAVAVGLANTLIAQGFNVLGPTREAGQIEWDKAWARDFMKKYDIPTPLYKVCHSEQEGLEFIKKQYNRHSRLDRESIQVLDSRIRGNDNVRWFIKASGLAEGKGAIPAKNREEAICAIREMAKFGDAGKTFVIEEWLEGEEFSYFVISDGKTFQTVGAAQDHKRVNDGDTGPNTGGMGCSSPPLVLTNDLKQQAEEIIQKTIDGLAQEGRPYKGILYLGGIVVSPRHPEFVSGSIQSQEIPNQVRNDKRISVIEFNARWGDPEAEVLVPGIQADMYELSMAVVNQTLNQTKVETDRLARVAVAGCSKGYPVDYSAVKGKEIIGLDRILEDPAIRVYGAGVKVTRQQTGHPELDSGSIKYLANGGRLFYIVGEGKDVRQARQKAYSAMRKLNIEGNNLHYRTDIGWRDVKRL